MFNEEDDTEVDQVLARTDLIAAPPNVWMQQGNEMYASRWVGGTVVGHVVVTRRRSIGRSTLKRKKTGANQKIINGNN